MKLSTVWAETVLNGSAMRAYGARPSTAGDYVPAIQAIWGVDEHIQDMAHRFAGAGQQTLASDWYSLGEALAH